VACHTCGLGTGGNPGKRFSAIKSRTANGTATHCSRPLAARNYRFYAAVANSSGWVSFAGPIDRIGILGRNRTGLQPRLRKAMPPFAVGRVS
jgi:hypothetical protein